jgi:hypothetical protein
MDIEASSLTYDSSREPPTGPTPGAGGAGLEKGSESILEELGKKEKTLREVQVLQKRLNDYEGENLELRFKLERYQGN